ncbi:MAG: phage head spike fiber domain-containing protein [Methyloligellaceae bacterium]
MIGIGLKPRSLITGGESLPWWAAQYPGATFVADFANNRAMINNSPVSFTDFLSVTRNSAGVAENANGTLVNHSTDSLRLSDRGVLIESARTNLVKDSQNFLTSDWSTSGPATVTLSSEQAPDGTFTAHHIQNLSATGDGIVFSDPLSTPVGGGDYTGSIYLRADTPSALDLTITAASGSGSPSTLTLNLTADWQRYLLPHSFAADDTDFIIQLSRPAAGNIQSFHAWGAQLEAGTYETSYIKTTSTQTQRHADTISFNDTSWLDPATGTIIMSVQSPQNTLTNRRLLGFASAQGLETSPAANTIENWNGTFLLSASTGSEGTWSDGLKLALSWDASGRSLCISAGDIAEDAGTPGNLLNWYLGSRDGSQSFWEGSIATTAYYPYKLTNSQLINLTT